MKKYINGFLRLGTAAALIFVINKQNQQIVELKQTNQSIKVIQNECDSLKSEMFIKDIQLGRYEVILDKLDTELDADCKAKVDELEKQVE